MTLKLLHGFCRWESHGRLRIQTILIGEFCGKLATSIARHSCLRRRCRMQAQTNRCPKNILFPTEFGEHSKDNFRHVIKLARRAARRGFTTAFMRHCVSDSKVFLNAGQHSSVRGVYNYQGHDDDARIKPSKI